VLVPPARAQSDRTGGSAVPAAASKTSNEGAPRLVRIGPQALIEIDEDGRMSMVDEDAPKRSRAAALAIVLGATFGIALIPPAVPALTGVGATTPGPLR
jgi:hypothetical protein